MSRGVPSDAGRALCCVLPGTWLFVKSTGTKNCQLEPQLMLPKAAKRGELCKKITGMAMVINGSNTTC